MNHPTPNPDEHDPAGIREALRRDAKRIEDAPFDMALQRETMARVREAGEGGRPRFRVGFTPALAMASAAVIVAVLFLCFLFKPSPRPDAAAVVEVAAVRQPAPRASILSYERAMAQGDAALSAALDRDAQTLLPASAKLPAGLL